METKKAHAHLDSWVFTLVAGHPVLFGTVKGHPGHQEGAHVRTSKIVKVDLQAGTAETLNTIYTLGESLADQAEVQS
jgi:hypothetical protein